MNFYSILGISIMWILGTMLLGVLFVSVLIFWAWWTKKIFLPKTILILMSMFEWPVKVLLWKINIDKIMVDASNKVYSRTYKKTPYSKRAIFLPGCLRHVDCPARLGPEGIECKKCGKCGIADYIKEMEKYGMKIFVVPGSSVIKRMLKKYRPKGVLGVGCFIEVQEGMKMVGSIGLSPQCVVLKRDGCVNTDVDWEDVKKMSLVNGH